VVALGMLYDKGIIGMVEEMHCKGTLRIQRVEYIGE
jgi:hypothetical protein